MPRRRRASSREGADLFVFDGTLGADNVDWITDFATEDTIRLGKSVFPAPAPGQPAESASKNLGVGGAGADDRVLDPQSTGEPFFDADGSEAGAAVKFAVLDKEAALTAADVFVM